MFETSHYLSSLDPVVWRHVLSLDLNNLTIAYMNILAFRFLQYVPPTMRASHYMVKTSTEENNCLYASASILLSGRPDQAMQLRLCSVLYGVQHLSTLEDEVPA